MDLTDLEFNNIDEYRRKKNTAVLTIMFTDIEGFTALSEEKGETYVQDLHRHHDRILVETIEEDNAGVVIKFIGDSVMAVFSEPTAAVEKALMIQKRLQEFNEGHPELADLRVRIGLHMGQTVIENKIRPDLFGRQVNKASRVESLASGGHIYLSYTVFDSVKSWLGDFPDTKAVCHGRYLLKGIPRPEEIYEVWQTGVTRPQAPKKGKKPLPLAALLGGAAAVAALVCLAILGWAILAKPEVYFTGMVAREPIVDFHTPLAVAPVPGTEDLKKSVTDLAPGRHIVHYEVSQISRYFAAIDVKPGKSVVPVKFEESYLPNVETNYYWGERPKAAPGTSRSDEQKYFFYDHKTKERLDFTGKVLAEVQGLKLGPKTATFGVHYQLVLNGKTLADQNVTVENPLGQTDRVNGPSQVLYQDEYHTYTVRYSCYNNSIQVDLEGNFKD